jgi:hypothetical protein
MVLGNLHVLWGLDFCFVYLDDILVFSRSLEDHERRVWGVFERVLTDGIMINPAKCVFRSSEGFFLD